MQSPAVQRQPRRRAGSDQNAPQQSISSEQAHCSPPMRSKEQRASAAGWGVLEAPKSAPWRQRRHSLLLFLLICSMAHSRVAAYSRPNCRRGLLAGGGEASSFAEVTAVERTPQPAAAAQPSPLPLPAALSAADVFQLPVALPSGSAPQAT